jgi:hypothetical protein
MSDEEGDWTVEHPRREEVGRLEAELKNHAGKVAEGRIREMGRAVDAFARTSTDLYALLTYAETDHDMQTELMRNVGDRSKRDAFMTALDLTMSAYGAAVATLIDIVRRIMNNYEGTDLHAEFLKRRAVVSSVRGSDFIRQLRNFLSHYTYPPINTRGDLIANTAEILLDPESLEKFDGWNAQSKALIAENPHGVRLTDIMPDYHQAVLDLYAWLMDALGEHHAHDIDGANALVAQINLALTDGVTDGSDWEERMVHLQENLDADREGRPQTIYADWKAKRDTERLD